MDLRGQSESDRSAGAAELHHKPTNSKARESHDGSNCCFTDFSHKNSEVKVTLLLWEFLQLLDEESVQ